MKKYISTSIFFLLIMTLFTGLLYPLGIYVIGQIFFRDKANGSIITINNEKRGSILIAQKFTSNSFLKARPSSADYATMPSGASQLSPTSKILKENIEKEATNFAKSANEIPNDLITTSASGLDPHISVAGALIQVPRIAEALKISEDQIVKIIDNNTEKETLGFLGEERVNVLLVNRDLQSLKGQGGQ